MNRKTIRSTVVRALAAGAMVAGVVGVAGAVGSGVASASSPFTYYASATGQPANAPCTSKTNPCDLATALSVEATNSGGSPGSVIDLAKDPKLGSYNAVINSSDLHAGNDNVTIQGAKFKKGEPTSVLNPSSGTLGANAIVDFTSVTGVTVEGIGLTQTTGNANAVVLNNGGTGDTLENSQISNSPNSTAAILAESGTTNITSDNLVTGVASEACSTTAKASPSTASAGWMEPGFVNVTKFPKCAATSGDVYISTTTGDVTTVNEYTYVQSGKKTIELTDNQAPSNPAIVAGDPVVFIQSVPGSAPYTMAGIDCTGTATCNISGGKVAGPTQAATGPVGIDLSGTSVDTVSGTSVTGNTDAGYSGPSGSDLPGTGIAIGQDDNSLPTVTLDGGGSVSGNDVGVAIEGDPESGANNGTVNIGSVAPGQPTPSFTASSGVEDGLGILLAAADGPTLCGLEHFSGCVGITMVNASASGSGEGAGLEILGSSFQTIGAAGTADQNNFSTNVFGVGFGSIEGQQSQEDTINNANITGNLAFGVEIGGENTPEPFNSAGAGQQSGNTIENSVFSGNGASSFINGANIADFDLYDNTLGVDGGPPTMTGSLTAETASTTGWGATEKVKNATGSAITVYNGTPLDDTSSATLSQYGYVTGLGSTGIVIGAGDTATLNIGIIASVSLENTGTIAVGDTLANAPFTAVAGPDTTVSGNTNGNVADPVCNATGTDNLTVDGASALTTATGGTDPGSGFTTC